ncbi:unnamed protein product [Cuscuta campestris]|uniref:ATP phosphoribosyltransferase n=1 Tax=Cuscuta campestris TaxID=132261 RepID=A0A484M4C4_9ASTE|nr:unnamed protein product [Cuscuta campestris]
MGPKVMNEKGLNHVTFSTPDRALKATPAMRIVDAIVDLVSTGTTLGENNLKEIAGGVILQIQAVLVAIRKSLTRKDVLDVTHEMLERLEAHLRALGKLCRGRKQITFIHIGLSTNLAHLLRDVRSCTTDVFLLAAAPCPRLAYCEAEIALN